MPDEKETKLGFTMMGITMDKGKFWNPIGKAFKLLENGEEDSVAYFYVVVVHNLKPETR